MKKSHIVMLPIFLLLIPATIYFGLRFSGRAYYVTSTLVMIETLVPFLLAFENRKPQARELVVIAVLSALAVAARVVIPIPNFKAIFAIIMLSGIAFGPETGFLVGAISAFASNFFYGQGPYKPVVMGVFGFLTTLLLVGPLLDTCSVFLELSVINVRTAWPRYVSGFWVNLSQGVCTFLTMVIFGNPLLEKLDRVKVQYGMMEDEDGL